MNDDVSIGLISGTGKEGRGIALRLAATGVPVNLGSRSTDKACQTARELNRQVGQERVGGMDNHTLVQQCKILFLTVPFIHMDAVLREHLEEFSSHQVLVDVSVPVVFDKGPRLLQLSEGSGAEYLRKRIPSEIPLVAAFKTLPAQLLSQLNQSLDCDEFISSDSAEAKEQVRQVVEGIPGLRWIDAGPLKYCRALEGMTFLAIGINRRFKIKSARFQLVGLEMAAR